MSDPQKLAEEEYPEGEFTSHAVQLAFRDAYARGYAQAKSDEQEIYQAALAEAPTHVPPPRTAFLEHCEVEIYEGLTYVRLDDVMHLLSDGTPSEEQIEKAARAFFREYHGEDIWPELRDDGELDTRSRALAATRVALTAAGVAPQETCPQPCEHLSAEDARDGRDCREHPCTCPTAPSSDREKLIEEARAVVPQAETPQCGPCRRGQHGCCDGNEYLRCECSHGAAPVLPSSGVDEDALAEVIARVTDLWDDPLDEVHDIPQIARAVAEWLKGQGGESRDAVDKD